MGTSKELRDEAGWRRRIFLRSGQRWVSSKGKVVSTVDKDRPRARWLVLSSCGGSRETVKERTGAERVNTEKNETRKNIIVLNDLNGLHGVCEQTT